MKSAVLFLLHLLVLLQVVTAAVYIRGLQDELNHFNDDCPSPCLDTEFCGVDQKCYSYSCDAWYIFGPTFFTNYKASTSEDLACSIRGEPWVEDRTYLSQSPACGDDWPVAIQFLEPDNPAYGCPHEGIASLPFSRKCTARPNATTAFVCYDLASSSLDTGPDVNEYVQDYLASVNNDTAGKHVYTLKVGAPTYTYFLPLGENNQTAFNSVAAQSAMSSNLDVIYDRPFGFCESSNGCRIGEFCGRDNACHEIHCENLYEYGPTSLAGKRDLGNTDDEGLLECSLQQENMTTGENTSMASEICDDNEWPVALEYRCSPPMMGNVFSFPPKVCPREIEARSDGRYMSFVRKCMAQPNPDQSFACFDMKGAQDVSLADYAATYVEKIQQNPICTSDNLGPEFPVVTQDWPMCPRNYTGTEDCLTARHTIQSLVQNQSYSTSMYWYGTSEDALQNDNVNLEALDKAIFSVLTGSFGSENENDEPVIPSSSLASTVIPSVLIMFASALVDLW